MRFALTNAMRIGIVAAEASGDALGGALIEAVRRRVPDASFEGVCGPRMQRAGCERWRGIESLSVMGLTEVLAHLPRLWRLRKELAGRWIARPPSVFVGIDAPDFNLGLERRLRRAGIPTAHYVSPSVWAWRQGRTRVVDAACDRVLCLFPFEKSFYESVGVDACYVGHPLADQMPMVPDRAGARNALGLTDTDQVVALLPGSRGGEIAQLGANFAAAAAKMRRVRPSLKFVVPMVSNALAEKFAAQVSAHHGLDIRIVVAGAQQCLTASDAALVASGTATLEAALAKTPMVVAYRISRMSRWLAVNIGGLKLKRYALPNLIADRELVREFMMDAATPSALAEAMLGLLDDRDRQRQVVDEYAEIHRLLRCGASERAAAAVLELSRDARG
jgi:lipid-A-disaccharide synthase